MTHANNMDGIYTSNHTGNWALTAYAKWNRSTKLKRELEDGQRLWRDRGFYIEGIGRNWGIDPQDAHRRVTLSGNKVKDKDSIFIGPYENSLLQLQVRQDSVIAHGFSQCDAHHQESVVATLISHANQTWGKKCAVSGSPEFKLQMWTEAYRQGVDIINFSPTDDVATQIKATVDKELADAGYKGEERFPPIYAGYGGFLHTSEGNNPARRSLEPGVMRQRLTGHLLKYTPMS